jgi:hypothetical protein
MIIGSSATGKTTLALRLSDRLGLPVFHLDSVAADGADADPGALHAPVDDRPTTAFAPRPLADRRRIVERMAEQPRWIAEGAFLGWTDPLLERAETIVWLDHLGLVTVTTRILDRVRRSRARESLDHEGIHRVIRPRSYLRHGVDLLQELWDVSGYFWRRSGQDVPHDIAARRWDRISRHAVAVALAPHGDRVLRIRDSDDYGRVEGALDPPVDSDACDASGTQVPTG